MGISTDRMTTITLIFPLFQRLSSYEVQFTLKYLHKYSSECCKGSLMDTAWAWEQRWASPRVGSTPAVPWGWRASSPPSGSYAGSTTPPGNTHAESGSSFTASSSRVSPKCVVPIVNFRIVFAIGRFFANILYIMFLNHCGKYRYR